MPLLGSFDPREAIVHYMRFAASITHQRMPNIATIQFLKSRSIPLHQLHCVMFQDTTGQQWYATYFLSHWRDGSWYVESESGRREQVQFEPPELYNCPWIRVKVLNFLQHSSEDFYVGGEVHDKGFHIVRVQLFGSNGLILEDIVQDGLVLFWSNQKATLPIRLELYNTGGEVVSHQTLIPPFLPSATRVIKGA